MIQGSPLAQQASSGTAERLIVPVLPAPAGLVRAEEPGGEPAVKDVTAIHGAEEAAQSAGPRAELVRAETTLQIAQEALAAIAEILGAMEMLVETALDETLSEKQRADLEAAFQGLKQTIGQIIDGVSFEGAPILEGGDGPGGEYQILLSAAGGSGQFPAILIPPVSVAAHIEAFKNATLLSVAAAGSALEGVEGADRIVSAQDQGIVLQHAALQRVFSTEFNRDPIPGDPIDPAAAPLYSERLTQLAADIVSSEEKIPFQDQAARFRVLLERMISDDQMKAPSQTAAPRVSPPMAKTGFFAVDSHKGADRLQTAEMALGAVRASLVEMHRLAEKVSTVGQVAGTDNQAADVSFQAIKSHLTGFVQTIDLSGEKNSIQGEISDGISAKRLPIGTENSDSEGIQLDVLPVGDLAPGLDSAQILTVDGATKAMGIIDVAITAVVEVALENVKQVRNATETRRALTIQSVPAVLPGGTPLGQSTSLIPGSEDSQPPPVVSRTEDGRPEMAVAGAAFDGVRLDTQQMGRVPQDRQLDPLRIEAQTEQARDTTQRLPGIMPLQRESDTRLELGVSLAKAMFEAPSDQAAAAGGSLPGDQGGFLAELRRVDSTLHVADLSIEQIELHLDYMRDLAEEASTDSSRHRLALDQVFQFVKSNIVDPLAQNTEAQGDKILSGGDGPDGEYVIRLSGAGLAGQGHDIGIPSMRVQSLSPDLSHANIRNLENATEALEHLAFVSETVAQTHENIAQQRGLIRKLIHVEMAHQGARA